MNVYELDVSWATTANERRCLHWQLLASERVGRDFDAWSRSIAADLHETATTNGKGALS